MSMTKDELKALPQSAFLMHGPYLDGGLTDCPCSECGVETRTEHYHVKGTTVSKELAICKACYALHPSEAKAGRRYVVGMCIDRKSVV